jgi:hypothetical protein
MNENRPLETVKQDFLFDMSVVCADEIFACKVYAAQQADGTRFTRVTYDLGQGVKTIDVDYWEEEGWIDLWYGEPSPW